MCMKLSTFSNEHAEHISCTSLLERDLNSLSGGCVGSFPAGTGKEQGKRDGTFNLKVIGCKLYMN